MSRRANRTTPVNEVPTVEPANAPEPPTIGSIQIEIASYLDDVLPDALMLMALTTGRLRQQMTVLSAEARAVAGAQHRRDRALRTGHTRTSEDTLGVRWLRRSDDGVNHGPTAAPANVGALSLGDAIARTLHRATIDLTDYDQVTEVPKLYGTKKLVQEVARLRDLTWAANEPERAALVRTRDALADLSEQVRVFIEGHDQRSHLRAFNCPHCHNKSLIVFWSEKLIRCDRVPGQEHYQPCVCRNALCECKNRPVEHRHTWHYNHPDSFASSWKGLARSLGVRTLTPVKPKEARP